MRARLYGMSAEQLSELLAAHPCCEICGSSEFLNVDHCHVTGAVRGVLCQGCNSALGGFKEDPERIEAALEYLRRPRSNATE